MIVSSSVLCLLCFAWWPQPHLHQLQASIAWFCRFRVLDECDEMLNMGFAEDVETILKSAKDSTNVQTLLFSATMPTWVKQVRCFFT